MCSRKRLHPRHSQSIYHSFLQAIRRNTAHGHHDGESSWDSPGRLLCVICSLFTDFPPRLFSEIGLGKPSPMHGRFLHLKTPTSRWKRVSVRCFSPSMIIANNLCCLLVDDRCDSLRTIVSTWRTLCSLTDIIECKGHHRCPESPCKTSGFNRRDPQERSFLDGPRQLHRDRCRTRRTPHGRVPFS